MPLIDLQWISSAINERTLEQAGIIANFFAGLLLAVEYLISGYKIDQLNNYLDARTSKAYNRCSRFVKAFAKFNRRAIFIIIIAVVLMALIQTIHYHDTSLEDYFIQYFSIFKPLMIHMRRILFGSLALLIIMSAILYIAHSAPKRTLGALGILLFIIGNVLLYLHTLFI
jgi:hypothetical protein